MSTKEITDYINTHLTLELNNECISKYSLYIYNKMLHEKAWLPLREKLITIFSEYVDMLLKNNMLGKLTTTHSTYFNDIYDQIITTPKDVDDPDTSLVLHLVKRYEMHLLSNYLNLDNKSILIANYQRMLRCFTEGNFELGINMGSCDYCGLDKFWLTFKKFKPYLTKYVHTAEGLMVIDVNTCIPN